MTETKVTLSAESSVGSDELELTITVSETNLPPVFTSTSPSNLNQPVDIVFGYTATSDSYLQVTYSLIDAEVNCPIAPAISIDSDSGVITWTPTETGTCVIQIRATNDVGSTSADDEDHPDLEFTLTVGAAPALDPVADFSVTEGDSISVPLVATPSENATFTLLSAPGWADIDVSTGLITGTAPTVTGSELFNFEAQASNVFGDGTPAVFTVTVDEMIPPTPAVLTSVPDSTEVVAGQTFTYDATATAVPLPITWSLTASPAGMTVVPNADGTEATISWTSGAPETVSVTIEVDNDGPGGSDPGTQSFDLVVHPVAPTPVLVTPEHPTSTYKDQPFSFSPGISAATDVGLDGSTPAPENTFSWSLESGPEGMTVNPSTGAVAWTPMELGPKSYTLRVTRTDYPAATSTVELNLEIVQAPAAPFFTTTPPMADVLVAGVDTYPGYSPAASGVPSATITAAVPADVGKTPGVYDVIVVQGNENYVLSKRLNVTAGGDATAVSGNITFNQSWTVAGSPYRVIGTVSVINGATLTIDPGATVIFGGPGQENNLHRIDVGVSGTGAIVANGGVPLEGDQIVFTAYQPLSGTSSGGTWGGLRLGAGLTFGENTRWVIQVRAGSVNRPDGFGASHFRAYPGIRYQTTGNISVNSDTTLEIAPGNTVRFPVNSYIDVGSGASAGGLQIDAPFNGVVLTSIDGAGQEWRGILFRATATESVLGVPESTSHALAPIARHL